MGWELCEGPRRTTLVRLRVVLALSSRKAQNEEVRKRPVQQAIPSEHLDLEISTELRACSLRAQ